MATELKLINSPNLAQVALEIAKGRREKLLALCEAVLQHDYEQAEGLAKELSGNETVHRVNQGQHRRPSSRR